MRRRNLVLLIVLLLAMITPVSLSARVVSSEVYNGITYTKGYVYDFQVDSIFYTIQDNGVYVSAEKYLYAPERTGEPDEVIINKTYHGVVTIPKSVVYDGIVYDVTGIDDAAFKGCNKLDRVYIPNSVLCIGASAFYDCKSLESISFPENLHSIGICSFQNCSKLQYLHFPDALAIINANAFGGCTGLKKIIIPNGISQIDPTSFLDCIIDSVFWNTRTISTILLANWKCSINNVIFGGDELLYINMAYGCNFTSVTFTEKVRSIERCSFIGCKNLKKIVIEGYPVIYETAFAECYSIDSIVLKSKNQPPIGLDQHGNFYGFNDVLSFDFFPATVFKNAVLFIPEGSIDEYMRDPLWSRFSSVVEIDFDNYKLNSDNDSKYYSVQEDGDTIYCSIQEDGDTIYYTVNDDGAYVTARAICRDGFYSRNGFDGPLTPRDPIAGGQQPRVIIRGTLKGTNSVTADNTSYHGSIMIPESLPFNDTICSVTGINYYAFVGCRELESVSIPESVRNLGFGSFAGCSGLSTVNIPSCVNEIPDALFYGCSSLCGIEIPSGVKVIGHSAFYGCSGLTEITIPAGVELIDEYAFAYCSGLKRVVIEGNPVIAETAFIGCGTELEIIKGGENDDGKWDQDTNGDVKVHYSIEGLKISDDTPGLHIIKYRNGTVRKAVVR